LIIVFINFIFRFKYAYNARTDLIQVMPPSGLPPRVTATVVV
jgi:hypothetical protein